MRNLIVPVSLLAFSGAAFSQSFIVTAEGHHGTEPPEITKDQVTVEVNKHAVPVASWTHAEALELYIVIDDGESTDVGIQFDSLKSFINSRPATTRVGLAYLRNGEALIAAPITSTHGQAARALRLPLGLPGISGSPYVALSDLIRHWPASGARREILVISNGVDPYAPLDPLNLYLQNAIAEAQRAGIPVHSIFYAGAGHQGAPSVNWGRNFLAELGEDTGGEAYWQGFGSPVMFDAFLKDFDQRLQDQYLLTLEPGDIKSGLVPFKITSGNPDVSLVAAKQIFRSQQPD